jgi:hypothetical protein
LSTMLMQIVRTAQSELHRGSSSRNFLKGDGFYAVGLSRKFSSPSMQLCVRDSTA